MNLEDLQHLATSGCSVCVDIARREIELQIQSSGRAVRGPTNPNWTVCYNIPSKPDSWVGSGWEFFDDEKDAKACYDKHAALGNHPTMRSYCTPLDWQFLAITRI